MRVEKFDQVRHENVKVMYYEARRNATMIDNSGRKESGCIRAKKEERKEVSIQI